MSRTHHQCHHHRYRTDHLALLDNCQCIANTITVEVILVTTYVTITVSAYGATVAHAIEVEIFLEWVPNVNAVIVLIGNAVVTVDWWRVQVLLGSDRLQTTIAQWSSVTVTSAKQMQAAPHRMPRSHQQRVSTYPSRGTTTYIKNELRVSAPITDNTTVKTES